MTYEGDAPGTPSVTTHWSNTPSSPRLSQRNKYRKKRILSGTIFFVFLPVVYSLYSFEAQQRYDSPCWVWVQPQILPKLKLSKVASHGGVSEVEDSCGVSTFTQMTDLIGHFIDTIMVDTPPYYCSSIVIRHFTVWITKVLQFCLLTQSSL